MINVKKDFPIFENNPGLVYLDSAATSQKPWMVIEAMKEFSEKDNGSVGRGVYGLSERTSSIYKKSRGMVADFIGSEVDEIVFTAGSTESLNGLSRSISSLIGKGRDKIVLSVMEHHSNIVCWQELAKKMGMKIEYVGMREGAVDIEELKELVSEKTALVSVCHVSNVLGSLNDVGEICSIAKSVGAFSIVDAAQSVGHMKVDVRKIGCDFLVFSGHKILGPAGIGVLYGRRELLDKMRPFNFGGGMIGKVEKSKSTWAEIPEKFEAGTQNVAGAVGLAKGIEYLEVVGIENVERHLRALGSYCLDKLKEVEDVEIYSDESSLGIISFNVKGLHPHDLASLLDDDSVCIRVGHHCAMPLMGELRINGSCRVSFYVYNSEEDVDMFVKSLLKAIEVLRK